jgi:hypothetical protein
MQIRNLVAGMLSAVLTLPAQTDEGSIREIALGTQIGSTVEVRLTGKERPNKLRGRMGLLDNDAFDLAIENSGVEPRRIPFGQVKSLKLVRRVPAQPVGRGLSPEATATAIPIGALVEVRFVGNAKPKWLRGRIGRVGPQELQVQILRSGGIDVQTIGFAEVESVRTVDSLSVLSGPAKAHRGIVIGIGVALGAALVVVIVAAVAAATGHVGG